MNIKHYITSKTCEKLGALNRVLDAPNRYRSMREIIRNLAAYVGEKKVFPKEEEISSFFLGRYETKWFPFEWMYTQAVADDMYCVSRMFRFFREKGWVVVATNVKVSLTLSDNAIVTHTVPFIFKNATGEHIAVNVFYKKADKSYRGRSNLTRVDRDVYACASKLGLERQFPNIVVSNLYLLSEKDTVGNLVPELLETSTKSSNIFYMKFEEFYGKEGFLPDLLLSTMESVIVELTKKDCSRCKQKQNCYLKPAILEEIKKEESSKGLVNSFTDRQMQAIKAEGPCLICAGPGSGKTATIVGKVRYMVTVRKIDPANILLISFTNEAVHEMRERISVFCGEDMPTVSTINGLAYRILLEHAELVRPSGKIPILTDNALKGLIRDLLSVTTSLDGINMGNPLQGQYGLLNTVMRYFLDWQKSDEEEFLATHLNLGQEFIEFAKQLDNIIQLRGFISFDEQLSKCYDLLTENPKILSMYQNIYKYILVDEVQDIDKMQADLIYLLTGDNKELTVVGDDDQAIYGWRGGSSEFMLTFSSKFGVNPIVLDVNFRSSNGIVNVTQNLISKSGTTRIRKDVSAFRKDTEKVPVLVPSKSTEVVERVIALLCKEGFSYKDIAILARTNAELRNLQEKMSVPSVLAKNYLCESSLFVLLLAVVTLIEDIGDNQSWFELLTIMGEQELALSVPYGMSILDYLVAEKGYPHPLDIKGDEEISNAVLDAFMLIANMRLIVEMNLNAPYAITRMLYSLGLDDVDCAFYRSMSDLIELYQINNIGDLVKLMRELRENGDTYKLPVDDGENAVRLYTMHESKGCEFPVVILLDNTDADYTNAESLRTLYVGLTRPKDRVFFLSDRYKEMPGFVPMEV